MKSALKSMSNEKLRKEVWRYDEPNPFFEELNRRDFKHIRAARLCRSRRKSTL